MVKIKRISTAKMRYKLRHKNTGNLGEIEHWLSDNCDGTYACQIDDAKTPNGGQNFAPLDVVVRFEHRSDQKKFKEMLLPRQ
jgi:hypothetical protein